MSTFSFLFLFSQLFNKIKSLSDLSSPTCNILTYLHMFQCIFKVNLQWQTVYGRSTFYFIYFLFFKSFSNLTVQTACRVLFLEGALFISINFLHALLTYTVYFTNQ